MGRPDASATGSGVSRTANHTPPSITGRVMNNLAGLTELGLSYTQVGDGSLIYLTKCAVGVLGECGGGGKREKSGKGAKNKGRIVIAVAVLGCAMWQ
jgi:hypothetical protein